MIYSRIICLIISCIPLSVLNNCIAQTVFKKNYDYGTLLNFNCYELPNRGFVTGIGGLSKLDSIGNVVLLRSISYPPAANWGTLVRNSFNNYFVDGFVDDITCYTSITDILFIGKLDSSMHLLSSCKYQLTGSCFNLANNMNATRNGGIISVGDGFIRCGNFACKDKYYALCIDSSMHVVWGKYYTNHSGTVQFGKQTPDGGFLLGFNLDSSGVVVAKTDSMGNNVWCKSYIRPQGNINDCVINADGTSIITGFTDSVNVAPQLFMIKLDTSGNVLWAKAFDSDWHWLMYRSSIVKTSDGGYAILGTIGTAQSYNPIIIKTDANGDTMWTAIHGVASGVDYEAISLLQTSDGGYLLGGDAPWAGIAAWLYKTDSLGRVPCNMLSQTTYTYPIFPIDSNVVLTSIDGAIEIPISLTDTTYSPRAVWDDCDYTTVPNIIKKRPKFDAYPNPTHGKLTIEALNPLKSDCWFSVYDYTGRLVFQRTLYTEKEKVEIDLSPYGKGLYLVEFTEKDMVSVKKVVVE